jgi:hypothetical protein
VTISAAAQSLRAYPAYDRERVLADIDGHGGDSEIAT